MTLTTMYMRRRAAEHLDEARRFARRSARTFARYHLTIALMYRAQAGGR